MCVQFFRMVSIDVPASVGAPPLNTSILKEATMVSESILFGHFPFSANRECYVVTMFDMQDFTDLYQSHVLSPCLYVHKFHLWV